MVIRALRSCRSRTRSQPIFRRTILKGIKDIIARDALRPDFEYTGDTGAPINFIHRRIDGAEVYFVANQDQRAIEMTGRFRVTGLQPELFHPETGLVEKVAAWREQGGVTEVPLRFDRAGSVFVVFRHKAPANHLSSLALVSPAQQAVTGKSERGQGATDVPVAELQEGPVLAAWQAGTWTLSNTKGEAATITVKAIPPALSIPGPWNVRFQAGRGAPENITLTKLVPWNEHADAGVKYYSGLGVYTTTFTVPADLLRKDRRLFLELGRVEVSARVRINGRELGILWAPPYRADASELLKSGDNHLEVEVANLWVNRLIGDEQLPEDVAWNSDGGIKEYPAWLGRGIPRVSGRVAFTTWKFWKKDDALITSGLLGPVVLRIMDLVPMN